MIRRAPLRCADCGSRNLEPAEHVVGPVRLEYTGNVGVWVGVKMYAASCGCGWRACRPDRGVVAAEAAAHARQPSLLDAS